MSVKIGENLLNFFEKLTSFENNFNHFEMKVFSVENFFVGGAPVILKQ